GPGQSRMYTSNGFALAPGAMVIADTNATALLTINSVTQGAKGSVTINADRTVTYAPTSSASGADAFTYTISDGQLTSAPATVSVALPGALDFTPTTLPDGPVGRPYDRSF